jgi:hypothetical protein
MAGVGLGIGVGIAEGVRLMGPSCSPKKVGKEPAPYFHPMLTPMFLPRRFIHN